jgi:predicted anti-sigma-YlaC factor YlaD
VIPLGVGDHYGPDPVARCPIGRVNAQLVQLCDLFFNAGHNEGMVGYWQSMELPQVLKEVNEKPARHIGLAVITLAAVRLHLQPGALSLLYLIVVVFVSLRAGFVSSVAVSDAHRGRRRGRQ